LLQSQDQVGRGRIEPEGDAPIAGARPSRRIGA
jgi:hypothetical protein